MLGNYVPLNWIDIAIAAALVAAAGIGFVHGLLRLLFATAAGYIAFILSSQYFHVVGVWLSGMFPDSSEVALDAVGFVMVFLIAQVGVNGLGVGAYRQTRLSRLGVLDQLAGSFIGLFLGFMIVSVVLLTLNFAVKVPWPGMEMAKLALTEEAANSSLMKMFLAAIPGIAETAKPWLPSALPNLFYL